jgi:hypothetical protein
MRPALIAARSRHLMSEIIGEEIGKISGSRALLPMRVCAALYAGDEQREPCSICSDAAGAGSSNYDANQVRQNNDNKGLVVVHISGLSRSSRERNDPVFCPSHVRRPK